MAKFAIIDITLSPSGNGAIDETEFVAHWTSLNLGDLEHAITLFHRADTDKNGQISKNPDFARLFYYFDRNSELAQEIALVGYSREV